MLLTGSSMSNHKKNQGKIKNGSQRTRKKKNYAKQKDMPAVPCGVCVLFAVASAKMFIAEIDLLTKQGKRAASCELHRNMKNTKSESMNPFSGVFFRLFVFRSLFSALRHMRGVLYSPCIDNIYGLPLGPTDCFSLSIRFQFLRVFGLFLCVCRD